MYDISYPTIFVVSDFKYIKYLQFFLFFVTKNVTRGQVFVHFINTPQQVIDQIQKQFPIVKGYDKEDKELNTKNINLPHPEFPPFRQSSKMFVNSEIKKFGKLYSDDVAYCANIRLKRIAEFLDKTEQDIIYIDVDNVVNKDLENLYGLINDNDILVVPNLSNHISTTLFYVKNNHKTVNFFKEMSVFVESYLYVWGIDSIAFNTLLESKKLKDIILPKEYYDETYNPDSVIWINHLTMYGMTNKYQELIDEIHFRTDSML